MNRRIEDNNQISKRERKSLQLLIARFAFLSISLVIVLSLGSLSNATPQQTAPSAQQPNQGAKPVEQMVPMRDGVKLATSIFLPQGKGPWPVVLVRTPYGKELQATGNPL